MNWINAIKLFYLLITLTLSSSIYFSPLSLHHSIYGLAIDRSSVASHFLKHVHCLSLSVSFTVSTHSKLWFHLAQLLSWVSKSQMKQARSGERRLDAPRKDTLLDQTDIDIQSNIGWDIFMNSWLVFSQFRLLSSCSWKVARVSRLSIHSLTF